MYEITLISLDHSSRNVHDFKFDDIPFAKVMAHRETIVSVASAPLNIHLETNEYDAIITPGNSFGHMTGGFDGAVVEYFGEWIDGSVRAYIEREWAGELPVGNARLFKLGTREADYLIYSPTMRVPKQLPVNSDAPYVATLAAFQRIARWNQYKPFNENRITSVLLPVMGMGTGRLPVELVARQMQMAMIRAVMPLPIRELGEDGLDLDTVIHRRTF